MMEKKHPAEAVAEKQERLDAKDTRSGRLTVVHISGSGVQTEIAMSSLIPAEQIVAVKEDLSTLGQQHEMSIKTDGGLVYIPFGLIQKCVFEITYET